MKVGRIGVVGLGRMGGPIAERLAQDKGCDVWGYDTAGSADRASGRVRPADSLQALAQHSSVVLLSLPTPEVSVTVCRELAANELAPDAVVELSTVGVTAAEQSGSLLAAAGIGYLDAPISGGVAGARSGRLSMMAAGAPDLQERLRPILEVVAHRRFVVGDRAGLGQAMKLINNYVAQAALTATCEATVLGEQLGLELPMMVDVLNASTGRSAASQDKFPRSVVTGSYDFGFATSTATKDVRLYHELARELGCSRALASVVDRIWQSFSDAHGDTDVTYFHRFVQQGGGHPALRRRGVARGDERTGE